MKKSIFVGVLALIISSPAMSAQWYSNINSVVSRIEQDPSGVIWLMKPTGVGGANVNVEGCSMNQVRLIPPAGREDSWLSMVLATIMSKNKLNVYGDCDTENNRINATRITIE
ncbi:MAG: hypothetical protein K6L76_13615 [Agarilytica sp.]